MRIYMRGIKIGTKKEGRMKEGMDIFAQSKKQGEDEAFTKEELKRLKDEDIGL